jgi:LysR family glycine cleavage system transcriptional activator
MAMNDRIPPLAALRAFAAVARLGSFARAAETLHVSTSAVSHQVRGLEATLGAALLTRARNGAGRTVATEAGVALQRAVERAFGQLGAACEAVRAIEDEDPDMVREGLDLAVLRVRHDAVPEGDRLLFSETVFPVCSPSLGLSGDPGELPRHALLQEHHVASPEKDWSTWLALLGLGRTAKVTIVRFYSFSAALAAAVEGAGVALGRRPLIDFDLARGRLVRPFGEHALAGSSDMVIRRRPGAARDVHVASLEGFLLRSLTSGGS